MGDFLSVQLENLVLRQLGVFQRTKTRPRIRIQDRILWSRLSRFWSGWRDALVFVTPATVIAWQRKRFRDQKVVEFPEVGGLHHRYERRAA